MSQRYLLTALFVVCPMSWLSAQDDQATKAAFAEVNSYRFFDRAGAEAKCELIPKPLLRYTNPVSGATNGFVFAWTVSGRPEVISALYQFPGRPVSMEIHSLSLDGITARRDDGERWNPTTPGVEFRPVPETTPPAKSASRRRIEMNAIIKRFTVVRTDPGDESHRLRLLPTPILRYGDDQSKVIDGAVYAFVQATNPDALVILEVREHDEGYRWEYGFARLHHRKLDGTLDGDTVWKVDQLSKDGKEDPRGVYRIFRR